MKSDRTTSADDRTERALAAGDHTTDDDGDRADGGGGDSGLKEGPDVVGRHGGNSAFSRGQAVSSWTSVDPGREWIPHANGPSHYGPSALSRVLVNGITNYLMRSLPEGVLRCHT